MTLFHFRLQSLLKLRHVQRDRCRESLAEAYRADQLLQSRQDRLQEEVQAARVTKQQRLQLGPVEVDGLLDTYRYELVLRAQVRQIERQRQQIGQEVERRRLALVEADRELRVLEKLRDRQAEAHAIERDKAATRETDETALTRFRAVRHGGAP